MIASAEEKRAIHFFQAEAAPILSGSLDTSFWSRLVLQISQSEPAVRLAVMAVGSLFEHMLLNTPTTSVTENSIQLSNRRYQFAIQCYNKAISNLMKRMEQYEANEDIALLTCVLFVCVEFLQGNQAEALSLTEKGSKVLRSFTHSNCELDEKQASIRSCKNSIIVDDLTPIFTRLGVLSGLFVPPPEEAAEDVALDDPFLLELLPSVETLGDARNVLFALMEKGQHLLKAATQHKWAPDQDTIKQESLITNQSRLLSYLGNWYHFFSKLDCSCDPLACYEDHYASSILRVYYLITSTWTSTCLDKVETSFDSHIGDFTSIVNEVTTLFAASTGKNRLPIFSFEMGVIPPLYFTAINCRHPVVRRQAVSLLRRGPRRETLWDAVPLANVAERVVLFEERNLERGTDAWPKEEDRVHDTEIGAKVSCGARRGYPVIFKTRPNGVDGGWCLIEDFIDTAWAEDTTYPMFLARDPGMFEQNGSTFAFPR